MKNLFKRASAVLLALLMVLPVLFGIIPSDTYAASYTYNTGTRHDYNTSLSTQAQAYYTGDYTWDNLSNLNGGNENCLDMNNPLFQALNSLMSTTMTTSVSYSSLPTYWAKTDASGGSGSYVLFYTDVAGPDGSMNREHVWPKSHASFKEKDGGADLHHLRPTIGSVNSARGNLIMGNVQGKSGASPYSYGGKVVLYKTSSLCEVNDNIKGDVARILLYVWCRWKEPNLFKNTSNPVVGPSDDKNDGGKVIESLETLLQWCKIDPVDTWEMSRNDQIQNVQGNRNVFIDYPEFAWLVFGKDVPTDLNTPSKNASGGVTGKPSEGTGSGNNSSGNVTDNSYTQISSLKDGDKVLIVNPASQMALSTTKVATYYNAGVDISGGFSGITSNEIFTVTKNSDGSYSFVSESGKKLALAADYSSLNETGINDKWELSNAGNGVFYLRNTGRDLYLEWYASKNNWSAYKPEALSEDYDIAFYKKADSSSGGNNGGSSSGNTGSNTGSNTGNTGSSGSNTGNTGNSGSNTGSNTGSNSGNTGNSGSNTGSNTGSNSGSSSGNTGNTGNSGSNSGSNSGTGSISYADATFNKVTTLNTGDKIYIMNPFYNVVLSTAKTGYYNIGVDVSEGLQGITDTEVFTVTKNADGSYSFTTADGKKLALGADYSSLNESGENAAWTISTAADGTFYLKNVARGNYLEWYADKNNWSSYSTEQLDDRFNLEFYKLHDPNSSPEVTEPTQEPTQPETQAPTQEPTDAPEATQPAPTVPDNSGDGEEKNGGAWIWILVVVLVLAVAGGVCYYVFVIRPKQGAAAPVEEEIPAPAEEAVEASEEAEVSAEEAAEAPAEEFEAPAEETPKED